MCNVITNQRRSYGFLFAQVVTCKAVKVCFSIMDTKDYSLITFSRYKQKQTIERIKCLLYDQPKKYSY